MTHTLNTLKLLLLAALTVAGLQAQLTGTIHHIFPAADASEEGAVILTSRDGWGLTPPTEKSIVLQAPTTMPSGTFGVRWFNQLPATTECIVIDAAGQMATQACGAGGGGNVFTDQQNVFTATPQTVRSTVTDNARWHLIHDFNVTSAGGLVRGESYSATGGFGLILKGISHRGTESTPQATADGQVLIFMGGGGYNGTAEVGNTAQIRAVSRGIYSASNRGSYWSIWTTDQNSTATLPRVYVGLDSPGAVTMLNDESIYMRDTGGTARNAIRVGSTNQLLIGETSLAGILLGDNTTILGNLLPNQNNLYDVGSLSARWNEGYYQAGRFGVGSIDQVVIDGNRGPSSVGDTLKINTSGGVNRISMGVTDFQNDAIISLAVSGSADVSLNADNSGTNSGLFIQAIGRVTRDYFRSSSGTIGFTGTCIWTTDLTIEDGLIVGCS